MCWLQFTETIEFILDEKRMVIDNALHLVWAMVNIEHWAIVRLCRIHVLYIRSVSIAIELCSYGSNPIPIWKESMVGYYEYLYPKMFHFLATIDVLISFNGQNANKECNASQLFAAYFVLYAN